MYNPVSTYRIQFNKDFTVKDLEDWISYFSLLGIGAIYASPIFKASPGSAHGYDVINPLVFNPEITNIEQFKHTREILKENNIGWLQDVVSNHMAYHPDNLWLMDVLEKGKDSPFSKVFDIEPGVLSTNNKLMVPFLGESPEEAIENGNIKLLWKKGSFSIAYYDNIYPINYSGFQDIFQKNIKNAPSFFLLLWEKFSNSSSARDFLYTKWEELKKELDKTDSKDFNSYINDILENYNSDNSLLKELIDKQYYELCHWQETEKRINYRRFFTVNGLICLRMEDKEVFDKYHLLIGEMIRQGYFNGLRIDHIDGLKDPNSYLKNLRKLSGEEIFIVVEKILEYEEDMPHFWPVQGNTGYDFLATVNNVFTSVKNYEKLRGIYRQVTHVKDNAADLMYNNKKMILTSRMHGEWDNLFRYFNELGFIDYSKGDVHPEEIKEAIGEFMLACPVYRLYPRRFPLRNANRKAVEEIFEIAYRRNPALTSGLNKLSEILLTTTEEKKTLQQKAGLFFSRLMQFTGPLMAKGVEDTSMYQYNCFLAHNEVGDAINARGITADEYHQQMIGKLKYWPFTMNTTSTHDTKRGEDVRARLNVISVLTQEWEENVNHWMQMNQKLKKRLEQGILEPSHSVEYFIYQTLLGTFPFDGIADDVYMERIDQYLVKALREAKRKVSWRDPDETYEETVCEFVKKMLDPEHDFLKSFLPFQQKVAWRGVVNSIAQLALKFNSPGVADIYQGTELWDLSLVDPDNRQAVDYQMRFDLLQDLIEENKKSPVRLIRSLLADPFDGKIKLWLTYLLINERKNNPELFSRGQYIPLPVKGKLKAHVLAFARRFNESWFLTAVPVMTGDLCELPEGEYIPHIKWEETSIVLPEDAPAKWKNILSGIEIHIHGEIPVEELFSQTTIGLFRSF